jgi:tRNA modification GTPase
MKQSISSIDDVLLISTKDDASIDNLLTILSCKIKDKYQEVMTFPVITKIRQKKNLELCLAHLKSFSLKNHIEIAAQEIRFASDYLGILTGKICVEEILDEIFASFCIGK